MRPLEPKNPNNPLKKRETEREREWEREEEKEKKKLVRGGRV